MLPPPTTRTGFPQVCPSMQKKVWRAMALLTVHRGNDLRRKAALSSPASVLSGRRLQAYIKQLRAVLKRLVRNGFDLELAIRLERDLDYGKDVLPVDFVRHQAPAPAI
jgi:hypothetical protein